MHYPAHPGHKAPGTSAESAQRMAGTAELLRTKALALLKGAALTADEVAQAIGETVLSIRPRISELKRMGLIVATSQRRPNISGHSAAVWQAI